MPADDVLLDTNLMVLLVVGTASPNYIKRHKRLQAYTEKDYRMLVNILPTEPRRVLVTPNTITETSNLAGQIAEPARKRVFETMRALLGDMDEVYVASRRAADHVSFVRLGITDAALLHSSLNGTLLITADLDLYLEAARQGRPVINFNHHIEANRPSA